ncbi:MAG: universal stress protein [Alphaproteobacteria bacterium]|nr:MAG: universal stress protein [Alphaproteobacteria bacterium]
MKSILLHVANDNGFESRLQVALDLAREYDGHVTCFQPVTLELAFTGDFYGTASAVMVTAAREEAEKHREEVEAHLAKEDVQWDWITEFGSPDMRLLDHSGLQDVVVVGAIQREGGEARAAALVGDLAIYSRAPVLVVPAGAKGIDVDGPVIVAWNGSVEAGNALRSALPILARATSVRIVAIAGKKGMIDQQIGAAEAAQYLSRHGISCEILELPADPAGIARTLVMAAQSQGASCIVMGCYGHSRLRETVFGGVTQEMLANVEVPLLLAH